MEGDSHDWLSNRPSDDTTCASALFPTAIPVRIDGVTKYISGGLKSFGSYTDREKPFNLYDNMKSRLEGSYYLPQERSGGIYQHVLDYPEGKVSGAMDFFYWENIDFGQGPTIRVNRVAMFPKAQGLSNMWLPMSSYMPAATSA